MRYVRFIHKIFNSKITHLALLIGRQVGTCYYLCTTNINFRHRVVVSALKTIRWYIFYTHNNRQRQIKTSGTNNTAMPFRSPSVHQPQLTLNCVNLSQTYLQCDCTIAAGLRRAVCCINAVAQSQNVNPNFKHANYVNFLPTRVWGIQNQSFIALHYVLCKK